MLHCAGYQPGRKKNPKYELEIDGKAKKNNNKVGR
jgi:hypothetical protein